MSESDEADDGEDDEDEEEDGFGDDEDDEMRRKLDEERVIRSGYLDKKGEKRKVSEPGCSPDLGWELIAFLARRRGRGAGSSSAPASFRSTRTQRLVAPLVNGGR